jgi:HD-like signal output (HDOD) protein/CheY-like chemotaxis protein
MEPRVRVAFVDDDASILTNLRRTMLAMLDEWEMAFFITGADLLRRLETDVFDVVVADMRMPDLDGPALLDAISRLHPEMMRVILTGAADNASIFRTVGPAHIYLPKPCDPAALAQAIRSRMTLRALMDGSEMVRLLNSISKLPSAPDLFLDLVSELRSPRSSAATVAGIIARDVAMTAELLKLTNSSYFSTSTTVSAPLQAVRILGLEIVQTLVLQLGIFRQFRGDEEMTRQIEQINAYSQALGDLAERLALAAGEPDSVAKAAHCAALLSAIGSLVLLNEKRADYVSALAESGPDRPLHEAEGEKFGADHTLIGAYLLGLWGFSDAIIEAITFSGRPSQSASAVNPVLTALHVARAVGPSFPLLPRNRAEPLPLDHAYLAEVERAASPSGWRRAAEDLIIPRESA